MGKKYSSPSVSNFAIVVPHGKSETLLANYIKKCLRLPFYIHPKKSSIQINGLLHELQTNYKDVNSLKDNSKFFVNIEKQKIQGDFKIFTLMDTDDCTEATKEKYINKKLFDSYTLKEYIVPIYTSPDLEHVLFKSKIIPKIFNDGEKIKGYSEIFDIPKMPYLETKEDELLKLVEKLRKNKDTNLEEFIMYCIEQSRIHLINYKK